MLKHRLLPLLLTALILPGCTVVHYPRHWDGGAPYPSRRPPVGTTSKIARKSTPKTPTAPSFTAKSDVPSEVISIDPETEGLLEFARSLVGSHDPLVVNERRFPSDCSGYVCAVYYEIGEELMPGDYAPDPPAISGTELIYRRIREQGLVFAENPLPGDLVFFDNTWDRDGNGQIDDEFTHIGIVEQILPDGTLEILHLANSGIGRIHMNLERPDQYRDEQTGEILNHKLRRKARTDPPDGPSLTAELFRSFGRLPPPSD